MSRQSHGGARRAAVVVVIVASTLIIVACALVIANALGKGDLEGKSATPVEELAERSERVDIDRSSGLVYVNNEALVYLAPDADVERARELFSSVGAASVDETMGDIGLYRLVFPDALSYEELTSVVETLSASPLVEQASLDPASVPTEDAEDAGATEERTPNDPWNGASWNVDRPRDENWGMEAIDAPGAWGHLDQLSDVRVGLVDTVPNPSHEDLSDVLAGSTYITFDETTGEQSTASSAQADDHGSHVAGIIGADWDNETGVSGVIGDKGKLYYCGAFYWNGSEWEGRYNTGYTYLLQLKTLIDQDVRAINVSQNTDRLIGFAASHGNAGAQNHLQQQADVVGPGLQRIIDARRAQGRPDFVICVSAGNSNDTNYYPDANQTYGYREKPTFLEWLTFQGEKGSSLAIYNNFLALMDEKDVLNRVIVVGSVGIDWWGSLGDETRYDYSS